MQAKVQQQTLTRLKSILCPMSTQCVVRHADDEINRATQLRPGHRPAHVLLRVSHFWSFESDLVSVRRSDEPVSRMLAVSQHSHCRDDANRYSSLTHVFLSPPRPPSRLTPRGVLRPRPRRILERVAEHPLRATHLAFTRSLRTSWRSDHPAATRPLQLTLSRRRRRRLIHGRSGRR